MLKLKKCPFKTHLTRNPMKGVVAVFDSGEKLKGAARLIRDRKIEEFDAFTPFPVHGIEEAMGLKRSFLPWVTFIAGLTGLISAFALESWTSAVDWPLNVGGKPFLSLPAFIPIMFELTVLFAGLATAGVLILVCGMPNLKPQVPSLIGNDITNDKFAIYISSEDPLYREGELTDLLKRAGAHEVRVV